MIAYVYQWIIERQIKGKAQFIHTLPYYVDYFKTMAKIKEQEQEQVESSKKTQLYCTEIDLYEQTRIILKGDEYVH